MKTTNPYRERVFRFVSTLSLFLVIAFLSSDNPAQAQGTLGGSGLGGMGLGGSRLGQTPSGLDSLSQPAPADAEDSVSAERQLIVLDVRILGNETVTEDQILARLKTRPERYFDPDALHADTREIMAMKSFRDVKTYLQTRENGVVVTFQVYERPVIHEIKYIGNREITDKTLGKNSGLEEGAPLDIYAVRMAKNRIEEFYRTKGFPGTEVEILEGHLPEHRNIVFMVHEQERQRIWKVDFVGNKIASDERLRKAVIKSKPGFLKYFFKGQVVKTEIEADRKRLEAYYKNLGFFSVAVQGEEEFDDSHRWLTIRWVINEGPRYVVENVSFTGHEKYSNEDLAVLTSLKAGDFFDATKMGGDVNALRDLYGSQGYVFSNIEAEPRFLEERGKLNLIYRVTEGEQYRVGEINVHIGGEYGFTKHDVVLNRISLRPGDIIDIRKIRNSERRLTASGLFIANPAEGATPKIEVKIPKPGSLERMANNKSSKVRGQSPDGNFKTINLHITTPPLR